jgi:hypothetical protein
MSTPGTGLDLAATQEYIADLIRDMYPDYEVYEDDILDEIPLKKDGDVIVPYIVIRWGILIPSFRARSFAGPRHDEYSSGFDLCVIASDAKVSRRALSMMVNDLVGAKIGPYPLELDGEGFYAIFRDYSGIPQATTATQRFKYQMNSNVIS